MKKVLLATTAVVLSAGFASAEVALSGDARMGLIYDGTDAFFTSRARVKFTMSGETDSGLSFGASFRADQAACSTSIAADGADADALPDLACTGGAAGNTAMNAGSVYVSGAFGKLSFGDNDSAANAMVGNVSGVGLTGLGDTNELGYLGQTDTSALYTHSVGALSFALSSSQLQAADKAISVGVKYATDAFSVALGYEDTAADKQMSLGLSGTFSGATVKLVAADRDTWASAHYALSVDYAINATTVTAFYANHDVVDTFGLGLSHDLGGGASLVGGVVDNGVDTVADFGLSFSF